MQVSSPGRARAAKNQNTDLPMDITSSVRKTERRSKSKSRQHTELLSEAEEDQHALIEDDKEFWSIYYEKIHQRFTSDELNEIFCVSDIDLTEKDWTKCMPSAFP